MTDRDNKYKMTKSLTGNDPTAFVECKLQDVSLLPTLNDSINPADHSNPADPTTPKSRFTLINLASRLEPIAFSTLDKTIEARYHALLAKRSDMLRSMIVGAWLKAGQYITSPHLPNCLQEMSDRLPINVLNFFDSSVLMRQESPFQHTPNDVADILISGIMRCASNQYERLRLNRCYFAELANTAAEDLSKDLLVVSLWQHGGEEGFAKMLRGNANQVVVYQTEAVEALMRRAEMKLGQRVQREARKLVEVATHVGDWRIW